MLNKTIFVIFLIFVIVLFKYLYGENVTYENYRDGKFLVRNRDDKKDAAQMLHKLRESLINFINELVIEAEKKKMHEEMYPYIKTIQKRLPNSHIRESSHGSKYTSYTTNKGEEIVLCLRSKETGKLHDMNEIMYVAIHEIAHVGCPEIGHTNLFYKINEFLLEQAIKKGYYKYIDYSKDPRKYCGITLTSNIL
jgi:predicted metal-dependent hydrolase